MTTNIGNLEATVEVDVSKAERAIKSITRDLKALEQQRDALKSSPIKADVQRATEIDRTISSVKQLQNGMKQLSGTKATPTVDTGKLSGDVSKAERELKKLDKADVTIDLDADAAGLQAGLAQASNATKGWKAKADDETTVEPTVDDDQLQSGLDGALGKVTKWAAAVGVAFSAADFAKDVTQAGMEFQSQLNTMKAVSSASAEQLAAVTERARELGSSADLTATSASDAAGAMTELAKGGFSVEQSMEAAKGTLQLASAAQVGAAQAATIQAQALQAFTLNASEAGRVSDILAGAANASSAQMTDVAMALSQAGTVANGFGVTIDDTATAIAMFANAGITGSDAGTLLKTALLGLTDQGKPAQAAIEELGLTVYDAQGKFVGLESLFGQLQKAQQSMTDEQYQANAAILFGSDAIRLSMVAAQQGAEGFNTLREAVTRQGQAAEVAAAQTEGLPGAMERLENTMEDLQLGVFNAMQDELVGMANAGVDALEAVAPAIEGAAAGAAKGARAVMEFGAGVAGLPQPVKDLGGDVAKLGLVLAALNSGPVKSAFEGVQKHFTKTKGTVKAFAADTNRAMVQASAGYQAQAAQLRLTAAEHQALAAQATTARAQVVNSSLAMEARWNASLMSMQARASAFTAGVQHIGGAMTRGLGNLVNMLGGPLNLALAGATIAVTGMVEAQRRGKQAQEEWSTAVRDAAAAQSEFMLAVHGTEGALSGDGLEAAIKVSKGNLAELVELGEDYQHFLHKVQTDTTWQQRINPFGEGAKQWEEDKKRAAQVREEYKALETATKDLGIGMDDLHSVVSSGGPEFDKLVASLQSAGPEGQAAARQLLDTREQIEALAQAGRDMPDSMAQAAKALDVLTDGAASAEDKLKAVDSIMQVLGLRPKDTERAMLDAAKAIDEVAENAEKAALSGEVAGQALLNDLGRVDFSNTNDATRELIDQFDALYKTLENGVMSGLDGDQVMRDMQPALDAIQAAYNLTGEQMDALIEQFGLVPDQVESVVALQGADEAHQKLVEITQGLREVAPGATIPVDAPTMELVRGDLERLGVQIEELPNGMFEVSVDDVPALEALERLGIQTRDLPGGHIEITDTTPQNLANLAALGIEVERDKEGRVVISDNAVATRDNILKTLDGLITNGKHIVTEEKRITYWQDQGYSKAEAAKIQGPVPVVGRADGGLVPRLARGGLSHGGYRLPTSGPGTERTDGFLGVGGDGAPTAWLDAGEFVVNGDSTAEFEPALWRLNAGDAAGAVRALLGLEGFASGGVPSGASKGSKGSGGGNTRTGAKGGSTVPLEPDMGGAIAGLTTVEQKLYEVEQGAVVEVDADTKAALANIKTFGAGLDALPDKPNVALTADTRNPTGEVKALGAEVDAVAGKHDVQLAVDAQGMDAGLQATVGQLTQLTEQPATVQANLDTEQLTVAADESRENLNDLGAQTPVPVADLNTAPLMSGVADSDAELERVGAAKATSVSDVDNSSALANIQGVINELNRMPVERVIRVVAHGTDTALAGGGKVPGLATGGQVDGYKLPTSGPGTGVVDGFLGVDAAGMPLVRLNAGEWVINDKRSDEYDRELAMINAGTFPKLDDLHMLDTANAVPGLFKGGVVSPDQLLSFARGATVRGVTPPGSLEGSPYIWGGGLLGNWGDCSGAMSGLAALAVGADVNGRKFATMNEGAVLSAMGFRPGLGPSATSFNIGWFNGGPFGGHTSGSIGGTNVEMGGGRGNGQVGGAAAGASHPQYTDHAWLPLGELVAFDYFRRIGDVMARRNMPGPGGYSPAGGLGVGLGGLGVGAGGAGVTLHDNGGWLQPGTFAYNGLGEPEPVLTPDKWRTVERMVDGQAAHWAAINKLIEVFPQFGQQLTDAGNSIDQAVTNLTKWSDTPAETATAWRSLAQGNLNYNEVIAAGKGHPMAGLGINTRTIIGEGASNQAISLARKAGYGADAEHALDQEIVVNIAMSEQTIRAYEELEDARAEESKATEDIAEAEKKLRDAREKQAKDQADAARAVRDAEEKLAEARKNGGRVAQKEVKPDKDGNVDPAKQAKAAEKYADDQQKSATKVRDAEEKLADARAKQSEKATDGAENVEKAEEALKQARMDKAKAAARVVEAQTGLQVAAVIAALEVIQEVSKRVSQTVVAGFEGAAHGAQLLVDAIGQLGDNMKAVAALAEEQTQQQLATLDSARTLMQAMQQQRNAEREQTKARQDGYRAVQQAEFDLHIARHEYTKNAGDAEINLGELRKQGIFDVHAQAVAADQVAIQSASNVATKEANLANARALMDQANFNHTQQVATANNELSHAQNMARIQADRLKEASLALARAQAFATGEMGGQDALQRYLEGEQKLLDAESKQAQATASYVSTFNPLNWFDAPVSKGLALEQEADKLRMEGQAQIDAYREQAMQDLERLNEDERKIVLEAMAKIKGISGYTPGDVSTGFVSFVTGNSDLMYQKKSKESAEALRTLNEVLTRSKYRIEAQGLEHERAQNELDNEEQRAQIDFQLQQIEQLLENSPQEDYLQKLVDLTEENKASLEQENKQLGTISGQLANKTTSTLMSIGGAGWGDAPTAGGYAAPGGGFGGISAEDMSLWASARVEQAWLDGELQRALVPVADTLADAVAAGLGDRPLGLPDTVVDGYYRLPVEGADGALADAAQRSSDRVRELQATVAGMARDVRSMSQNRPVGTQYNGPVTVQSGKADELVSELAGAIRRA